MKIERRKHVRVQAEGTSLCQLKTASSGPLALTCPDFRQHLGLGLERGASLEATPLGLQPGPWSPVQDQDPSRGASKCYTPVVSLLTFYRC